MFNKKLIQTLKNVINNLEDEKAELEKRVKYYQHDLVVMLDNSREQRKKIEDLENNIEFLVNNLSPAKRKLLK